MTRSCSPPSIAGLRADRLAERSDVDDGDISTLRKGFRGAGRLVGAADGPRIAVLSVDGWDTHSGQGGVARAHGSQSLLELDLDVGMNDFKAAAGAAWARPFMLLVTEFGRTVRVNGDDGTDHGVGTGGAAGRRGGQRAARSSATGRALRRQSSTRDAT